MVNKKHTISFCIVCMNRLCQLKQTLLQNINDNIDYEGVEFVLLDYNSTDGLYEWAKDNLSAYIASGILNYYQTREPQKFNHSHSKNVAFKLAKGEIICNINADHFVGPNFAIYVNQIFSKWPKSVITTINDSISHKINRNPGDVYGKMCVRKKDFLKINGYDERMHGYGFEDVDFVNRIELSGARRIIINQPQFLKYISHTNELRYDSKKDWNRNYNLYINYIDETKSRLLIMYSNGCVEFGTLIDQTAYRSTNIIYSFEKMPHIYENSLEENTWKKGYWVYYKEHYVINLNGEKKSFSSVNSNQFSYLISENTFDKYYLMSDSVSINSLDEFKEQYENRIIMEDNLRNNIILLNQSIFGIARLSKNFSENIK